MQVHPTFPLPMKLDSAVALQIARSRSPSPHPISHSSHGAPNPSIPRSRQADHSMHDMGELLKSLTLTSMALGSGQPSSAFVPPPPLRNLQWSRSQAVPPAKEQDRRWSDLLLPRCRRQQRSRRSLATPAPQRWSSSSAASSDAAREEEPWPGELSAEAPFFPPFVNQQQRAAASSPAAAAAAASRTSPGGEREAFTFAPKPLPEGRVLREMEEADIEGVLDLAFEEYYEGPTEFAGGDALESFGGLLKSTWERAVRNGQFEEADAEQLTDWFEMVWLRVMIRWGFRMRVKIGQDGKDHRVFCVSDEDRTGRVEDGRKPPALPLAAVAEVSLQVPNGKTSPPFPLPLWVKRLKAWPGPVLPYISNVLVHPKARRQGLGNRLMQRCEQQARDWGYTQVYLHVDLTYYPAVRMYETMGYELVNDLEASFETPRLRYMKKYL